MARSNPPSHAGPVSVRGVQYLLVPCKGHPAWVQPLEAAEASGRAEARQEGPWDGARHAGGSWHRQAEAGGRLAKHRHKQAQMGTPIFDLRALPGWPVGPGSVGSMVPCGAAPRSRCCPLPSVLLVLVCFCVLYVFVCYFVVSAASVFVQSWCASLLMQQIEARWPLNWINPCERWASLLMQQIRAVVLLCLVAASFPS